MREQDVERVVVGLPLTLRGERGRAGARDGGVRRGAAGRPRRPVETYDERFTTALAARKRRSRTRGRPRGGAPPRELPRQRSQHDEGAALRACSPSRRSWPRGCLRGQEAPARRDDPPPLARLRIIFPEGFTRREMADRVAAVRQIAIEKRGVTPRLTRTGYLQASGAAVPPPEFRKDWKLSSIEGFLFPATYEFTKLTSSGAARPRPARGVPPELAQGRPPLRALEEPHAVRRPDHRVDDREGDRRSRGAPARRGGDLQPAAQPHAARDRRDDPLRPQRAGHRAAQAVRPRERQPVQHAEPARPSADARSRTRGSRRCVRRRGRPRSTTSTSCASPTASITSSRRASPSSARSRSSTATAAADPVLQEISPNTTLVGLLRWPGRQSLSPRDAQRRLRGSRPGLGVRRASDATGAARRRGARPRRNGIRRRERHDPAQGGGDGVLRDRRALREHARRSGRTGRGLGARTPRFSTVCRRQSPVVIGDGGVATAFMQALPSARQFARRGTWPPDRRGRRSRRERDVGARRGARRAGRRPDARRSAVPGHGHGRRGPSMRARRSSAGSRYCSRKGSWRSSSGPACPRRSSVMRDALGLPE